jgi:hypothetical protein
MKKILFFLCAITCLSCTHHKFKYDIGDIVYVKSNIFIAEDDSLLVSTIKELSCSNDSLKAKVVRRVWVNAYQHPYYSLVFYNKDGNIVSLSGKRGFMYEHIKALPEQRLY